MSQGRGHFICGAIFGIALGFAVGHLLMQTSAGRPADVVIALPESLEAAPPQVAFLNTAGSVFDRYPVSGGEGASTAPKVFTADAFTESPGAAQPEEPKALPRTDAQPLPLPAAATSPAPVPVPVAVPAPTPVPAAAPKSAPEPDSPLEEELRSVPQPQREVWRDALEGVPAADAAEIVRMWKIFGGKPGLAGPLTSSIGLPSPASPLPDLMVTTPAASPASLRDVAPLVWQQLQRDLVHADTPGYLRSVPVMAEEGSGAAKRYRVSGLRVDLLSGERVQTGNPWDIALVGPGYLQVTSPTGPALTRAGGLGLDGERRLGVTLGGQVLPLVPEIRIPAEAQQLLISDGGKVSVVMTGKDEAIILGRIMVMQLLNPVALGRHSTVAGLFVATATSGAPWGLTEDQTAVSQCVLERSNVDAADVARWFERLEFLTAESLLLPEQPEQPAGSHPGE